METRSFLLPVLLVLNGGLSFAIAERASTLRQSWQIWEVRNEAQSRLKYWNERGGLGAPREGGGGAGSDGRPPMTP